MECSSASGYMTPGVSEDSVDIYDGLDVGVSSTEDKSPGNSERNEYLDLYEDLVAEEQLSRKASYTELNSRFQVAQTQIKGLNKRLEQLETQNTALSKENLCLKKNISALLRTARQEVTRKDAEIQRLTQWAERGRHSHQSRINSLQDLNSPTVISKSRPPSSPPPPPSSQSKEDHRSGDLSQPSRKESHTLFRSTRSSPHSHVKRDNEEADKSNKQRLRGSEGKYPDQKLSEPTDKRSRDCSRSSRGVCSSERESSSREDKATEHKYDSCSQKHQKSTNVQGHRQPDRVKSSSRDRLRRRHSSSDDKKGDRLDRRPDKVQRADCDGVGPEYRKIKSDHKPESHSNLKDRKNPSSYQHVKSSGDFHKDTKQSRQKDHQSKGDRGHKEESKRRHDKRSSLSEESKKHDKSKPKELNDVNVDLRARKRSETFHVAVNKRSGKMDAGEKSTVNEKSSDRKLCFMETLNLTLSPNKKPQLPVDGSPNVEKNDSQVNMEDMCVIDEADNSELETDSKDVLEQVPDNPKASSPERTDVRSVQEKDKKRGDISSSAVQPILTHCQTLDRDKNLMTAHLLPKSTDDSSLKTEDNLKHNEDKTELVSNSHVTEPGTVGVINKPHPSDTSEHISGHRQQNTHPKNASDLNSVKEAVADSNETPAALKVSQNTTVEVAVSSQPEDSVFEGKAEGKDGLCSSHLFHQEFCPPSSTSISHENDGHGLQDGTKSVYCVSSTISLDSLPQEGVSLTEAIHVLAQVNVDTSTVTTQPSSSTDCIGVSKVSSTTEEEPLPESYSVFTVTPKKSFSPSKIHGANTKTSSSVPLVHDEDSMMRTLNNLKKIPDAISPLRSPVRITKRSLVYMQNKPGHVKALQKDFSIISDPTSKKLDVNKENKYPGSQSNHETEILVDEVSVLPPSRSDAELEEGEILSESEETTLSVPAPAAKRPKLTEPVKNKPSSPSVLKRKSAEKPVALEETPEADGVSTHSPKSRFKTVCPAGSKDSFYTIEEIMEKFKLVRTEIRKKYMKLHKTFPKKSFYGVMDNFEKSFLEFVDGAHFGQICFQAEELKSKLKKLISSVFSKVVNSGIVKRLFEQQSVDLKQKLWDFVDTQVEYLFKDITSALKSLCKAAKAPAEEKGSGEEKRDSQQAPVKKPQKEPHLSISSLSQVCSCAVIPYKTGLGSRGKDIRMTFVEKDSNAVLPPPNHQSAQSMAENLQCEGLLSTPEKNRITSLMVSQNCSIVDKTDFELLTEQQTSSLTYNLVRDSQMGEIFKCLLQGSDLLEGSGLTGDQAAWSLSTPRKDEERFLSITTPSKFTSPSKFDTPHKLIATWSSISPRKLLSPRVKDQMRLNPALFDESCLLEVPSEKDPLQVSQKSYSILAEDLAVSLTLPSPLKSDSHLSFLQPSSSSMHISTPDSVVSAHISEDALLDEEDATEQDIHLALDTDNSSSCSSSMMTKTPATPFGFKLEVPMKALVMEKSNDHFIIKIRQTNTQADILQTADENINGTFTDKNQCRDDVSAQDSQAASSCSNLPCGNNPSNSQAEIITLLNHTIDKNQSSSTQQNLPDYNPTDNCRISSFSTSHHCTATDNTKNQEHISKVSPSESNSCVQHTTEIPDASEQSQVPVFDLDRDGTNESKIEKSFTIDTSSSPTKRKKKPLEKLQRKRSRSEEEESLEEASPSKKDIDSKLSPVALSPSRVSAKNVVKKKGEVVMAWTRHEDRTILMDLKMKGASRETFSALSEKLSKPSGQIAHRFHQLMKLFKRQEKMDT
ncbi:CASP8-associated protein 2 [Nematolebias whitei]|uniref:CASP8-associated protein 2 n=1 Tax=Nematolebias whitei TaxID=451745 RepID=UPI001897FDBD|nr:CASP8-associated protein 2 [Nematolebias whitei]